MLEFFEKRKLKKKLNALSPDQKSRLKYLWAKKMQDGKVACTHGIPYERDVPCVSCFESSARSGDVTVLAKMIGHM